MTIILGAILNLFAEMCSKEPFIYFVGFAILSGGISTLRKLSTILR